MPRLISALRQAGIGLVCCAMAACAQRAENVMMPVEVGAAATNKVEMLVATTRLNTPDKPGEMFSGERGHKLSYADIVISIPPDGSRVVGEVQWPERSPGNPEKEFVTLKADFLDYAGITRRFRTMIAQPKAKRQALVFVHGYNTKFDDAVMRFAQIIHDSGTTAVPILFTWPSRGNLLAYVYDKESASYSRDSLEALLEHLSSDPTVSEVSILAHSMGNWVTMEALRTMVLKNKRIHPKIRNIMLASPDVDIDVFHTQMRTLGAVHPRMTLFVSKDDHALGISRRVSGDVIRLGAIDPEEEPYKSQIARNVLTVIDLSKLKTGDRMAHSKFADSPDVVKFIGKRLAEGQKIDETQGGQLSDKLVDLASETGHTIGSVAGGIVTAPIRIIVGGTGR